MSLFLLYNTFLLQLAGHFPDSFSKFVMSFGIATILDPVLIFIIDILAHNYGCTLTYDACKIDYTSDACKCFNGDFIKLYIRMVHDENSGFTGILITLAIYIMTSTTTMLLLYDYMVYVHKNARYVCMYP